MSSQNPANVIQDNVQVGAYGWRHVSWQGTFYPDDLPQDWMLSYYSNELNTVLVPADYWQQDRGFDCESWLLDINENFSFYVECPEQLLVNEVAAENGFSVFLQQLSFLQQHLAGVVISGLPLQYNINPSVLGRLQAIARVTRLFSYHAFQGVPSQPIWLCGMGSDSTGGGGTGNNCAGSNSKGEMLFTSSAASLAVFDDDLRNLRETRPRIQDFASQMATCDITVASTITGATAGKAVSTGSPPAIMVKHPSLKASDLIKLRSLLEIMGL